MSQILSFQPINSIFKSVLLDFKLKRKVEFFCHTNQIPGAQLSHVACGYYDAQTLPSLAFLPLFPSPFI